MQKKDKWISIHPIESEGELILSGIIDIPAGFQNISQDYLADPIDLIKELVPNQAATHYGRIRGDSMKDAGLEKGDILLIDKSIEYNHGDMAVCVIDGEFTIKYLYTKEMYKGVIWLIPDNPDFEPIKVTEDQEFNVFGVVIRIIKYPKRKHFSDDWSSRCK